MSTKTLRKRIALVAVSALTAGLVSVAPANAAAAGSIALTAAGAGVATAGVCNAGTPAALETAEVLTVGGSQAVTYTAEDTSGGKYTYLVISGPAVWSSSASGAISSDRKSIYRATELTAGASVLTPTGTGLVRVWLTSSSLTGTAVTTKYIQVVSSCTNSIYDPSTSFSMLETAHGTADSNVDETSQFANDATAYLDVVAKSAYGVVLPSGTWIASATNGALVGIADAGAPTCGSTSQAFATALGTDIRVAICQPTSGVAVTTTVSLSYNGTAIATKTLTITGDLAKIEVTSVAKATQGDQNYRSFKTRTFDAAGNQIAWPDASLTVSGVDTNVTAADAGISIVDDYQWATNTVTCASGAKTSSTLKVKGLTAALTYVESAPFIVSCSKNVVDTYTATLDKKTYVSGDIATLTISAKDSNGNVVADAYDTNSAGTVNDTFTYIAGSSTDVAVATGSNMTAVTAPAAGDYTTAGVKTYKFIVGTTAGSYQMTVQMPGVSTDTAKTVAYTISGGDTSNAAVLKAIVSLIASINKQIALLQKALLKK